MTPNPSRPGIWTSRNTRSGSRFSIISTRFQAVGGSVDDFDIGKVLEEKSQFFARQWLVIDQQRRDGGGAALGHQSVSIS